MQSEGKETTMIPKVAVRDGEGRRWGGGEVEGVREAVGVDGRHSGEAQAASAWRPLSVY